MYEDKRTRQRVEVLGTGTCAETDSFAVQQVALEVEHVEIAAASGATMGSRAALPVARLSGQSPGGRCVVIQPVFEQFGDARSGQGVLGMRWPEWVASIPVADLEARYTVVGQGE